MNYKISQQILQVVLNYLSQQPWKDTNDLISALRNLPQCKEEKEEVKEKIEKAPAKK